MSDKFEWEKFPSRFAEDLLRVSADFTSEAR